MDAPVGGFSAGLTGGRNWGPGSLRNSGRVVCRLARNPNNESCELSLKGPKAVAQRRGSGQAKAKDVKETRQRLGLALCASLFPWLPSGTMPAKASELLDATVTVAGAIEAEVQAMDLRSLLAGDLAMLVAAPLVVYAALRVVFWGSEDEPDAPEGSVAVNAQPALDSESQTNTTPGSYASRLTDPELQFLASKAAQNIIDSVRYARESCAFQSSLHYLAVKHGGAQEDFGWIQKIIEKSMPEVEDEADLEADLTARASGSSGADLCHSMTRAIAQRAAVHEVSALMEEVRERQRNKSRGGLFK